MFMGDSASLASVWRRAGPAFEGASALGALTSLRKTMLCDALRDCASTLERACFLAGGAGGCTLLQILEYRFSSSGSFLAGPWVSTPLPCFPSNATLNSRRNWLLRRPDATHCCRPDATRDLGTENTTPRQHLARSMPYMTPGNELTTRRPRTHYATLTRDGEPLRKRRMNRAASGSP